MKPIKIIFCLLCFNILISWHEAVKFRKVLLYKHISIQIPHEFERIPLQKEMYNYQVLKTSRFGNKRNTSLLLIDVFDTSYRGNDRIDSTFMEYCKQTLKSKQNPSVEFLTTNVKSTQDISIGFFSYSYIESKEKQYGAQAYIKCLNRELLHVEFTCPWPDADECGEVMQKMIASIKFE